jgi:hypothetical protein
MPVVPVHSHQPDSFYAWQRLVVSLALSTIGGVGLWSAVVVLPVIEAEFAVDRGGASVPYTATMVGFAIGGILWVASRTGSGSCCRWRSVRWRSPSASPPPRCRRATGSSCSPRRS